MKIEETIHENEKAYRILKSEVERAIKDIKKRKATDD